MLAPIVTGNFCSGSSGQRAADLQATVRDKFHILSNANKTMLARGTAPKNAYHDCPLATCCTCSAGCCQTSSAAAANETGMQRVLMLLRFFVAVVVVVVGSSFE